MTTTAIRSIAALCLSAVLYVGCGDSRAPGTVEQSIEPCNQGEPSFDVWMADFAPQGRRQLFANVDTRDSAYASGFRLVVACQGEVLIDTIRGAPCDFPPPGVDECPSAAVDLGDLADLPRVECLAEIGPTQPLDVGDSQCANPERADYTFRMTVDNVGLALDFLEDNCRAPQSCLQDEFDIDVDDDD
jgi:hypothetical protein